MHGESSLLRWPTSVVLALGMFIALGTAPRIGITGEDGYFYYYGEEKILLELSSEYVAVRLAQGVDAAAFAAGRADISGETRELKTHGLVLRRSKTGSASDEDTVRVPEVASDSAVETAFPVFVAGQTLMIAPERFIVQFHSDATADLVESLAAANGVRVAEKVSWQPDTYILETYGDSSLNAANAFHPMEDVVYAEPDFIRIMPRIQPRGATFGDERMIFDENGKRLPPDMVIPKGTTKYRVVEPAHVSLESSVATGGVSDSTQTVTTATIKAEGFEGAFPNAWELSGSPTWGVSGYRAYEGSRSAHCAGGSILLPVLYPNNADNGMIFGPFCLEGAEVALLNVKFWLISETDYDRMLIGVSKDGSDFWGYAYSGDWTNNSCGGGWVSAQYDFEHHFGLGDLRGEPEVWILIGFDSNETNVYEGAYVDNVYLDKITSGLEHISNDQYDHYQWSLNNLVTSSFSVQDADIDAPEGWEIGTGRRSTVIAIVDEGVDLTHPDLVSKLVGGYDATGQGSAGGPSGDDAHGTNCAGIAAAVTDNGIGVAGIAQKARIMPVRIAYRLDDDSWATSDSWIADGIRWAVDNGADVLSNSWGGGTPSTTRSSAIDYAKNSGRGGKGCVVLFSAGNADGNADEHYPSAYDSVLAVGALSPCNERKSPCSCDGEEWWGSNYGSTLDLMAPGVHMYSTDIQGTAGYASGDYYYGFNGTSAACPAAAGVAALIIGSNPTLTAAEVEQCLKDSAVDVGETGWDEETGYGVVNIYNALSSCGAPMAMPLPGVNLLLDKQEE